MSESELEKALLARARNSRESSAFSALVVMHQGSLRGFLFRLSGNYHKTDDLAQETFITAYEKLSTFKGHGSFVGWLFKIAFNCFLQYERRAAREQQINTEYAQYIKIEAEKYESLTGDQIDMEKAINRLNSGEAAAITLCHSYGFSHGEVADILNSPLGTVKSNIKRGKEKLKQLLAVTPTDSEIQSDHKACKLNREYQVQAVSKEQVS